MKIKLIVEKHADSYVVYPLGIQSVVLGESSTHKT
jgi:hypothetical protein